ncbi:RNA-binding protein [Halobacteriales archaeon QH_10_65_19]|nr:MAG: RNA-binding protein [Halobacteriales archaeon QH_10_65_19]
MEIKSRHHLRSDAIDEIQEALAGQLGVELDADSFEKVVLADSEWNVVLVDGDPLVLYVEPDVESGSDEAQPFLTVRGANAYPPQEHVVTVDAGAIEFVSNGADIMRPGIVEAGEGIEASDLVVVTEESHGKSLAIGRAMVDGDNMVGDEGRVVESIHHVGDDLYELSI